nr:hypothetical protein [Bacteroides fragilis]
MFRTPQNYKKYCNPHRMNPENYVLGEPSHRICSTKEEELFDK